MRAEFTDDLITGNELIDSQHEEFKQTIQELNEMLQEEEGPSDAFVQKVEEHVVKWFYRHISSFDRSVAEYINMRENGGRL